jgi:hypothetical protein
MRLTLWALWTFYALLCVCVALQVRLCVRECRRGRRDPGPCTDVALDADRRWNVRVSDCDHADSRDSVRETDDRAEQSDPTEARCAPV